MRGDRNLDNNSDSFEKHVSPVSIDSVFSLIAVFWCNFAIFFLPTLSLFNECVQSCVNFKVINYSYRGGIYFSYDI